MIERKFIAQKTREFYIQKYVEKTLGNVGISSIRLKKIPLGEKIVIATSRPSLIVGSKGSNIKLLTRELKSKFKLENPQIEINEVKKVFLDANIVAERIVSSLERFGSARFKGVGHKMLDNVMKAGAMGVEIHISGKIPGSRAKTWRFYMGYLKKCGDVAISGVRKAKKAALLKSGIIGVQVAIMPPGLVLPDSITILDEPVQIIEEVQEKKPKKKAKRKTKKVPKEEKSEEKKVESAKEEVVDIVEEKKVEEAPAPEVKEAEVKVEEPVQETPKEDEKPVEATPKEVKTVEKSVEKPVEEKAEEPKESNEEKKE